MRLEGKQGRREEITGKDLNIYICPDCLWICLSKKIFYIAEHAKCVAYPALELVTPVSFSFFLRPLTPSALKRKWQNIIETCKEKTMCGPQLSIVSICHLLSPAASSVFLLSKQTNRKQINKNLGVNTSIAELSGRCCQCCTS